MSAWAMIVRSQTTPSSRRVADGGTSAAAQPCRPASPGAAVTRYPPPCCSWLCPRPRRPDRRARYRHSTKVNTGGTDLMISRIRRRAAVVLMVMGLALGIPLGVLAS
ncbi:MAG: hypothetical protein ACRDGJ_11985, partial [Candidatus Limnocylindria bacterium]